MAPYDHRQLNQVSWIAQEDKSYSDWWQLVYHEFQPCIVHIVLFYPQTVLYSSPLYIKPWWEHAILSDRVEKHLISQELYVSQQLRMHEK